MKKLVAALVSLCVVAAPAHAASLRFDAVPQQGVSAVKWLGSTKLVQQRTLGRVSVVPRGLERGKLAFDVEVHNYSDRSAFFGQESVDVSSADQSLAPATAWDAERDARRKATWTRIGVAVAMVALVGLAVAAGGAPTAGQSLYIPSAPRRAAPAPDAASGTAVPETTSVPSRHLYSGRILVERPKGALRGRDLSLMVRFNGEDYPFSYTLSEA
ncbi:MAG TPA: hypothetical protein VEZ70_15135 [Allosphingosinicella sp.]|nr:hypothetical protein [Allosphingosinicella sp.]